MNKKLLIGGNIISSLVWLSMGYYAVHQAKQAVHWKRLYNTASAQAEIALQSKSKPKTNSLIWTNLVLFTNTYSPFQVVEPPEIAFVLDTYWTTPQLFELRTNGVAVVKIMANGDVIYDTNHVSDTTRVFWRELTIHIMQNFNR